MKNYLYVALGQIIRSVILAGIFALGLRLVDAGVNPSEISFPLLMIIGYVMDSLRSLIDQLVIVGIIKPAQARRRDKMDLAQLTREYIAEHGVDFSLMNSSATLYRAAIKTGDQKEIARAQEVVDIVKAAIEAGK